MMVLGPDFRAGLRHALYRPHNPVGLWPAVGIFVVLLIGNQLILVPAFGVGIIALTGTGQFGNQEDWLRPMLLAILPAGLLTVYFAWLLARRRRADPRDVLALRKPALGIAGWVLAIGGFLFSLYLLFGILSWLLGIDVTSSGLVEQGVMRLGNDPLFFLIAGGIIIGAPLAEELTFRGQFFAALAQTPLGIVGASLITSALWASIHLFTQPFHIIALLFLMGLALCWLLVRFGSLWVTIACHAVWNAMSAIALYVLSQT